MHDTITDDRPAISPIEAIASVLAERIGHQKYRIWFKESTQLALRDNQLRITVPNAFTANWIKSHFLAALRTACEAVLEHCPTITLSVAPELAAPRKRPASQPAAGAHAGAAASVVPLRKPTPGPKLRLNLETFVVGPTNELAYNAARAVIQEQRSPFNPLFIHGGYGVGKTHLLQGLCRAVVEREDAVRWQYLSAEDFANQFVLALKTKKLEVFRERVRRLDLLAIDDIHFLANKPSTQEEFLHTFNTISLAGKQVVLVSDAPPKMIGQLSDKLVNRFVSGMVVKIDPPNFEMRCEICRRRAQTMVRSAFAARGRERNRPPQVPEEVIAYIAKHVRSNVRELEGALLKVVAFAALQNQTITLPLTQEVLADHVEHCDPMVRIADIENVVAAFFGTTATLIHSAKKDKTVSLARHFAMFLARKYTHMSSSEVGRLMGNKNHATVLVGCKRIDGLVESDAEVHWRSPAGNRVAKARDVLDQLERTLSQ